MVFVTARRISEALKLYEKGADYVILPQIISGQKGFELIQKMEKEISELKQLKLQHIKFLNSIHNILY